MKTFMLFAIPSLLGIVPAAFTVAQSKAGAPRPLIEIVEQLEADGYRPFTEIDKEHGNWEIEVYQAGAAYELTVDSATGRVLTKHRDDPNTQPPKDSMPLSKVLKSLADGANYKQVEQVDFERRYWEIEVTKDGQQRELLVDPMTARILEDRLDD